MSFGSPTPESLVVRSDSKNPATTCKGITANGRPCRRALAQSSGASPTQSPSRGKGVLAVLEDQDAAAYYCWQHKEQGERLGRKDHKTKLYPLEERTSIDSLADRVGVLDLDEEVIPRKKHRPTGNKLHPVKRRDTMPSTWHDMQGPVMSVPLGTLASSHVYAQRRPRKHQSNTKFSWTCCIRTDDSEDEIPARRSKQYRSDNQPTVVQPTLVAPMAQRRPGHTTGLFPNTPTIQKRPGVSSSGPTSSNTPTLLSLIPPSLNPQTTSTLLAELSKPISTAEEEGYIYVFWLTPESEGSKPDDDVASSLFDVPVSTQTRRTSDALQRYASVRRTVNEPRKIMLKIGRAANVHRRLSQWTKQCGQNITLIRYYPYDPSSGAASSPKKVPHVHRLERLIHIELAEKRIANKGTCVQCGREHREWFEVEATRKGLKEVDEVIRRWAGWVENQVNAT